MVTTGPLWLSTLRLTDQRWKRFYVLNCKIKCPKMRKKSVIPKLKCHLEKNYLISPTKRYTIRILINNRSLLYSTEPENVYPAELRGYAVKGPEIRFLPHNPEVLGSNPSSATRKNRSPWGYGFLIGLRVIGYEKSLLHKAYFARRFFNKPQGGNLS
jgi:hypothetical protein